ncbi:MAG: DUF4160 domain-containing protein [Deltaproteobacteria bacterium]|jgi:hypothetical protein|nr:DUF4160 domain-containing protein [Deltaproteobacteria bacterium]
MPVISMFYGIIISMYYFNNRQHKLPHIHVKYQDQEAIFSIPDGELIGGELRSNKSKLVQAWIEIHNEELMADWELAVNGQELFRIDPLK